MIAFTIPGSPKVLKRHRISKWGGMYDPSKKDKEPIAMLGLQARLKAKKAILTGPVNLTIKYYGLRVNADLSNALKLIEDALNGVMWIDDKQVCILTVFRCEGKPYRTEVSVEEI